MSHIEALPWFGPETGLQPSQMSEVQESFRVAHHHGETLRVCASGVGRGSLSMERLNRTRSYDRESCVVEVEAGATFGAMGDYVLSRGGGMQNLRREHPDQTIGALLSRYSPLGHSLWNGSLREATLGIHAVTHTGDAYRYTPSPRKASGPDLRYVFIGAEGRGGAIVSAEIVASPRMESAVAFEVGVPDLATGLAFLQGLFLRGFRAPNVILSGSALKIWVLLEGARYANSVMRNRLQTAAEAQGLRVESLDAQAYYNPGRDGDLREGADPIASREVTTPVLELVGSPFDLAKIPSAWSDSAVFYDISGHQASAYLPIASRKELGAAEGDSLFWDGEKTQGGQP